MKRRFGLIVFLLVLPLVLSVSDVANAGGQLQVKAVNAKVHYWGGRIDFVPGQPAQRPSDPEIEFACSEIECISPKVVIPIEVVYGLIRTLYEPPIDEPCLAAFEISESQIGSRLMTWLEASLNDDCFDRAVPDQIDLYREYSFDINRLEKALWWMSRATQTCGGTSVRIVITLVNGEEIRATAAGVNLGKLPWHVVLPDGRTFNTWRSSVSVHASALFSGSEIGNPTHHLDISDDYVTGWLARRILAEIQSDWNLIADRHQDNSVCRMDYAVYR